MKLHEALNKKQKTNSKKKHIQVTMEPEFYAQVDALLKQQGYSWQKVLHTALEVFIEESKTQANPIQTKTRKKG